MFNTLSAAAGRRVRMIEVGTPDGLRIEISIVPAVQKTGPINKMIEGGVGVELNKVVDVALNIEGCSGEHFVGHGMRADPRLRVHAVNDVATADGQERARL